MLFLVTERLRSNGFLNNGLFKSGDWTINMQGEIAGTRV